MQPLLPEWQAKLIELKDAEVKARHAFADSLTLHRRNALNIAKLKAQAKEAKATYVDFYTSLHLSRQGAWQADKIARGLCRLCGERATVGNHCAKHDAFVKSYKNPRKTKANGQ